MLIWLAWANKRASGTRSNFLLLYLLTTPVLKINTPSPKRFFLQPITTKRFDCFPMQLCLRWFVAFCVPVLPMSWQLWVQHLGCMLASRTKSDVQVWWPRERILSDEGVVRSQTQNHLRLRSGVKIPCFDKFWRVLQFRKGKVIWHMDSVNGVPDGSIVMFPVYTHVPYRIHFLLPERRESDWSTLLSFLLTD